MTTTRFTTRRTLLATGVGLSGVALAGCLGTGGGGGDGSDAAAGAGGADGNLTGTVKFWTINLRKNFQDYFDQLISDFEEQHPDVTVEWVDVPGQEMQTKYLASLTTGDVPDAVNVDSKNLGQLATTFANIEDLFSEDEMETYQSGLVDGLRVQNTLYAIPRYNEVARGRMAEVDHGRDGLRSGQPSAVLEGSAGISPMRCMRPPMSTGQTLIRACAETSGDGRELRERGPDRGDVCNGRRRRPREQVPGLIRRGRHRTGGVGARCAGPRRSITAR